MIKFSDTEDEVCLLASEEEIDTENNNAANKLPSHLALLENNKAQLAPSYVTFEPHTPTRSSNKQHRCCARAGCFVFRAASLSAIGGVLFGYDVGIISGALLQIKEQWKLSCFQQELVVSSMLVGAIFASCVGGFMVDYFGRKRTIIVNSLVFTIGALVLAFAPNFTTLIVGRFVLGFAVAVSVIAECVYISEISPAKRRGFLVSLNEIGIVLGFLLAYVINFSCIHFTYGWRLMFGLSALPAVIQGVGMCFLPESPRFLLLNQQELKARQVLERLYDGAKVEVELDTMKWAIQDEKSHSVLDLFRAKDNMRYRMCIGMCLVFLQQFTGQPNVLYYAPIVFQSVGFHSQTAAILATIGLGVAKVFSCILALLLLDRVGRRKLFMFGAVVMTISISALGFVTLTTPQFVFTNPCAGAKDILQLSDNMTSQNVTQIPVTKMTTLSTTTVIIPSIVSTTLPTTTSTTTTTTVPTTTPIPTSPSSVTIPTTTTTIPTTTVPSSTTPSNTPTTTTTATTVIPSSESTADNLTTQATTESTYLSTGTVLTTDQTSTHLSTGTLLNTDETSTPQTFENPATASTTESDAVTTEGGQSDGNSSALDNSSTDSNINTPSDIAKQKHKRDALENNKNSANEENESDESDTSGGNRLENSVDSTDNVNSTETMDNLMDSDRVIKWLSVALLMCYVFGFELGFGTGTWLILAEIFPSAVRGRAIAIATILNWATNLLVSLTFLDVLKSVGIAGTFLPYGVICGLSVVFLFLFLPETKGRTLEEIGQDLTNSSVSKRMPACCRACCKRGAYEQIGAPGDFLLEDRMELHESD